MTITPNGRSSRRHRAAVPCHSARIRGCNIASNRPRTAASRKTRSAIFARSKPPSDVRISGPNAATTSANPGVPGATTSRAT